MNTDKLFRLANSGQGILDKYSNDFLQPGETKLGDGTDNVVVGPDKIETNSANPAQAGFSFSSKGSNLRQGAKLDMEGDYQKLFFRNGEQQLNPLGHIKASSTTDPLPTVVTSLRSEFLSFFTDDLQKLLDPLRAVV